MPVLLPGAPETPPDPPAPAFPPAPDEPDAPDTPPEADEPPVPPVPLDGGTAQKPMLKCVTFAVRLEPVTVLATSSNPPLAFDQQRCTPGITDVSGIVTATGCAKVVPDGPN